MSGLSIPAVAEPPPDIASVAADLTLPKLSTGTAGPGKRVKEVLEGNKSTELYHVTWLPTDWKAGERYPVIVELAGNGPYRNGFASSPSSAYPAANPPHAPRHFRAGSSPLPSSNARSSSRAPISRAAMP